MKRSTEILIALVGMAIMFALLTMLSGMDIAKP